MNTFALRQNMEFDWKGATYRILRFFDNGNVQVERLEDGLVLTESRASLLQAYTNAEIASREYDQDESSSEAVYSRPLADLPVAVQNEAFRRKHYLDRLLEYGSIIFTDTYLKPLISEIAVSLKDSAPPSRATLNRWYRRYRKTGDPRSLIPRHDLKGPQFAKQDERVLQLLTEVLEQLFSVSPRTTGRDIHAYLLARVQLFNRRFPVVEHITCPAVRTIYRLLNRIDVYDITAFREGKAAADRRLRISVGGVKVKHVLERVEVDHTPLDLFLIDEKSWLPLGRPTLTVFLDCFSRMPLGYYLTFGSPSAAAVMGGLRHAILPKVPVEAVLPKLACDHEWPCYGQPEVLVVDNGLEFHGTSLESVCFDLGIRIVFCPKRTPRFKGRIERYLKTINHHFVHQIPGTSFAKLHERGDYDPAKHALLTLAEFKQIFEKWILDIYAQDKHRGIDTTPWAKWQEGLARREPTLPGDVGMLAQRIGLVEERSLRHSGIELMGNRYSSAVLEPILRAYGIGVKVRIAYDPEDLGQIQVWGPDAQDPISVPAVDQELTRGLTAFQNALIRRKVREDGRKQSDLKALALAKYELVTICQELMGSRKQKHRRQAAALRGITSSKPSPETPTKTAPLAPPKPKPRAGDQPDEPPVPKYGSLDQWKEDDHD